MLIDSHCHLDMITLEPKYQNLAELISAAHQVGVGHMLCVCVELDNFERIATIQAQFPHISLSVGEHPSEHAGIDIDMPRLLELAALPTVIAIGETGLDYYHNKGDVAWQQRRFEQHVEVAKTVNKPIIIHTREAKSDTLRIMRETDASKVGGIMHCFTEDVDMAMQAIELGFYISLSGIVTFKNAAQIQAVAKAVPLDKLLIETDAPFLAPVPMRGKTNEPAFVKHVAEKIAELREISFEEVAAATTQNFKTLFPTVDL